MHLPKEIKCVIKFNFDPDAFICEHPIDAIFIPVPQNDILLRLERQLPAILIALTANIT